MCVCVCARVCVCGCVCVYVCVCDHFSVCNYYFFFSYCCYYYIIYRQGLTTTKPRKLDGTVPILEAVNIMRALGFYPTDTQIAQIVYEVTQDHRRFAVISRTRGLRRSVIVTGSTRPKSAKTTLSSSRIKVNLDTFVKCEFLFIMHDVWCMWCVCCVCVCCLCVCVCVCVCVVVVFIYIFVYVRSISNQCVLRTDTVTLIIIY